MNFYFYFLIFFVIYFFCANSYAAELKRIDGRMQYSIEYESDDKENYLDIVTEKNLFPIIDFKSFTKDSLDGKVIDIKYWRGKIVIVHFWATWCNHCVDEMIKLNNFSHALEAKEISDKVVIIPIAIDDSSIDVVRNFYKEYEIDNLSIYHDKENIYLSHLGVNSLPVTFIVNQSGRQIALAKQAIPWDTDKSLAEYIESLLVEG